MEPNLSRKCSSWLMIWEEGDEVAAHVVFSGVLKRTLSSSFGPLSSPHFCCSGASADFRN